MGRDYTSKKVSDYLETLISVYTNLNPCDTKCGYACSDHASWMKSGYAAGFTFEGLFEEHSPYIHGSADTIDHIDFKHMREFVRLGLAWVVETGISKRM